MRHFAQVDSNNVVVNCTVSEDDFQIYRDIEVENEDGTKTIEKIRVIPEDHRIIEYSLDGTLTNNQGAIGSTFDESLSK